MNLNTYKFCLASAISFSIIWIVCSLLVWFFPEMMMSMAGDMLHADLSSIDWQLSFRGVLTGLVAWAVTAGVIGWLLAFFYNRLL